MTVNELLGLSADASQTQIMERTLQLVQSEKDLLKITGKEKVADAFGFIIAQKDAATELEKARTALSEWEQREHAREATERKDKIDAIVKRAIVDGRLSVKDTERQAQLVSHGEKFGIESLEQTVGLMSPRPVRQFQAPPPGDTVKAQLVAIDRWCKENPGKSRAEAYAALSAAQPDLFGGEGVAVSEEA